MYKLSCLLPLCISCFNFIVIMLPVAISVTASSLESLYKLFNILSKFSKIYKSLKWFWGKCKKKRKFILNYFCSNKNSSAHMWQQYQQSCKTTIILCVFLCFVLATILCLFWFLIYLLFMHEQIFVNSFSEEKQKKRRSWKQKIGLTNFLLLPQNNKQHCQQRQHVAHIIVCGGKA